ncbi:hypothetical protein K469DRAFT_690015 [Zopfia rhizophila CBS 207.26]|uniref:3-carboxymuconate cyclase n=1 Tax=Zopfia rhizophila CBS 207.26 TaxID=1314779 RepID=A0A6A6DZ53_9PEZI|nr:hypothetical protein K469DRAFT_690015 [Zopfia rhizophila CBS 207.26]
MYLTILLPISLLAPLLLAAPSNIPIRLRPRQAQNAATGKAIYFITNDAQNAVVAMPINADGTLGDATLTATGGSGSTALDAKGQPAVPDALIGQSSLTIAGQNLFAVNAGSNSVSMFTISPNDPCTLQQVGEAVAIQGTFPNTVAASPQNSLVCVGSTGSQSGISCANFDAQAGIGEFDALRPLDLGQSDPPVGPTNSVSQTFFSEDESMLFTTVKGDPAANKTGFLSVFPVNGAGTQEGGVQGRGNAKGKAKGKGKGKKTGKGKGKGKGKGNANAAENPNPNSCAQAEAAAGAQASLSTQETRSSPPGTAVLFGSQVIPGSNPPQIFATDASFGAAILSVDQTMSATLLANQSIDGQSATCWSTISPLTNTAFVTDVGVNRMVEMRLDDASIVSEIDLSQEKASSADPGLIDLRAAGGFVYALSPGNGTSEAAVSVVDAQSKQLVQHATLGKIGVGANAMGMAVLV